MKKLLALAVAGTMAVSLAACGSTASSSAAASSEATSEAASSAAESAAESVADTAEGGKVGVCIYKFDDAFMTTYRKARATKLPSSTATTTRPSRTSRSTPSSLRVSTL